MRYRFYLHQKNILIYNCIIWTDDLNILMNHFGKTTIEKGLRRGFNIEQQIHYYKKFINTIYKRKINCYKIRSSDLDLYFASFFVLMKLKQIDNPYNDIIILKIKNKKISKLIYN